MFYEPGQFPDTMGVLGGLVFNLGFEGNPGGDNKANQVLNDHTYCCQKSPDMCDDGEPPLSKAKECYDWHELRVSTRSDDA